MANKPNNPALWSKSKSLARSKFDVYPSAYANGWAAKHYKSKGGTWRKAQQGMQVSSKAETQDDTKPTSFREKVFRGDYDKERKSLINPQITKMSERGTAKNIMTSGDASRRERVRVASEYTGIPRKEVRNQNPTAVGKVLRSIAPGKVVKSVSGQSPFWGASKCQGGGCKDAGMSTKYKKGGLTPANKAAMTLAKNMKGKVVGSDRMLKHGGTHSRLKQAYLNKYK
jgi:hypothetical protein